jgi:dihydroneopterin aldolase
MTNEELQNRFTYHSPKEGQPERYVLIRDAAKELAELVLDNTPASREQSLAITKLEEVVFWANAAVARNE